MSDFQKALRGVFGKKPPEPMKPPIPESAPTPAPIQEAPNLKVAAEAQKIFSPEAPAAPAPGAPGKAMLSQGTAPVMGVGQNWGKPNA